MRTEYNDRDKKRCLISAGITFGVCGIGVVLLLVLGLRYPDPPPPELGVELDAGQFSDVGTDYEHAPEGGEDVSSENSVSDNELSEVTQQAEDVPLHSKPSKAKKPKTKQPVVKPDVKPSEPQIDQNALFPNGKVMQVTGGSAGVGNGSGTGSGGDGKGSGTSFSLDGRGSKTLSKPKASTSDVGNIVVEIKVDPEGNVVSAKAGVRGTTLWDTNLFRLCEQAAKRSKFTAKPDAPELQKGTITYIFR